VYITGQFSKTEGRSIIATDTVKTLRNTDEKYKTTNDGQGKRLIESQINMTCDQPQSRSNNILGIQYKLMLAVEG
jgi:hypothetical protein